MERCAMRQAASHTDTRTDTDTRTHTHTSKGLCKRDGGPRAQGAGSAAQTDATLAEACSVVASTSAHGCTDGWIGQTES